MIKDSSLVPDFYVHPGYLVVDQVLDQIGKNVVSDWVSDCIKTSKIVRQTRKISGFEIVYLTPLQEAVIRERLGNSNSTSKKYTRATSKLLRKKYTVLPDKHISEKFFQAPEVQEVDVIGRDIYRILEDERNRGSTSNTQVFCNVAWLPKDIEILREDRFSEASGFEIRFNTIDFSVNNLEYEDIRINLKNLLTLTKVRNTLRDALVEGTLCSYIEKDGQYNSIPANVWADEQEWCRLLLEGFKAEIVWQTISNEFNAPIIDEVVDNLITDNVDNRIIDKVMDELTMAKEKKIVCQGRVFFKKSEVKDFLGNSAQVLPYVDGLANKESWEKLLSPKKPWLKLLNELALSLPEEVIESKTKKELMRDIRQKANLSGLVPTDIKIELLATFLRSPEQEKGKARCNKLKEEKAIE